METILNARINRNLVREFPCEDNKEGEERFDYEEDKIRTDLFESD